MSDNKKRNIYILTDNPKIVLDRFVRYFYDAEFAKNVVVEDIRRFSASAVQMMENSINTVMFITNTERYKYDLFLGTAIINILENQDIKFLVVDSVTEWRQVEATFDEVNPTDTRKKKWTQFENLFNWYQLNELIEALQRSAVPENIIHCFITDNDRYIDRLFDDLLKKLGDRHPDTETEPGPEEDGPINSHKKLPICGRLPKIFMGWIWRVWYAPIRESNRRVDGSEPDLPVESSDTDSYVRRTVIMNLGDKVITYIQIKPSIELDLSEVINDFNYVYIDLNTTYNKFVFGSVEDDTHYDSRFMPILTRDPNKHKYQDNDWLTVMKNYITIGSVITPHTDGSYPKLNYHAHQYKISDQLTGTIRGSVGVIDAQRIALIDRIDPPPRPEK